MNTAIQKVLKQKNFYTICLLLILFVFTLFSLKTSTETTFIDTNDKALTLVKSQLSKQQYTAYLPEECFFYLIAEQKDFFIVEIYELGAKTERCKGTDGKIPLVVLYKVKKNGSTEVFDSSKFNSEEMVPYQNNYAKILNDKNQQFPRVQ